MNSELVKLLLKVLVMTAVIMLVIMICCIITPRIAGWIDKKRPQSDSGNDENHDMEEPTVRGPYDASKDDNYDLNYKIYNKDIYGVDFLNGKKRKKDGGSDNLDG